METLHSSIDIGSNTIRLWIAEKIGNSWETRLRASRVTRLSGGFDGQIQPAAIKRTMDVLSDYSDKIQRYDVQSIRAACTGVTRKAKNTEAFLDEVERVTGVRPSVISGKTEAELTARGAVLLTGLYDKPFLLFDIGGFSTEIIGVEKGEPIHLLSLDLGAVSLTEKHLDDVPGVDQVEKLFDIVNKKIQKASSFLKDIDFQPETLIGTAGTPTTMAAIIQGLESYDSGKVEGFELSRLKMKELLERARGISSKKRLEVFPSLEKGREDVLVTGVVICLAISERYGFEKIRVTEGGLLEGLLWAEKLPIDRKSN